MLPALNEIRSFGFDLTGFLRGFEQVLREAFREALGVDGVQRLKDVLLVDAPGERQGAPASVKGFAAALSTGRGVVPQARRRGFAGAIGASRQPSAAA